MQKLECPVDIWGSGWKGKDRWDQLEANLQFHAVRGPLTARGLNLPINIALGDPALLLPHLFPHSATPHNRALLIQHLLRIASEKAATRAVAAGCDETLSTLVYKCCTVEAVKFLRPKGVLFCLWNWNTYRKSGISTVWRLIDRIAGASFVLTGSLHGAILAEAYGVPWAAYTDGYVDAPPKWADWGAYLGIKISFVSTLREGKEWWREVGRFGSVQSLRPLLEAFPYIHASATAQNLAENIDALCDVTPKRRAEVEFA
jgi:hypothetical protein